MFLFLLVGLFQLVPLPHGLLKVLSPATALLYEKLGFSSGFHPLSQSVYSTTAALLQWGAYAGAFALVATFSPTAGALKNERWIVVLVAAVFVVAFLEAIYGLYSGFNRIDSFLWFDRPTAPGVVSGTFINPDHFAGFVNMAILVSLGLFTAYWGAFRRRRGRRTKEALLAFASSGRAVYLWLLVLGLLVMMLASSFSLSRMGHLSLLAGLVFMVIAYSMKKLNILALLLILVVGGALLWGGWKGLDPVVAKWGNMDSKAYWARLSIWTGAATLSRTFPALGTGLGTFELAYAPYEPDVPDATIAAHTHNDYLQTLTETGLAGFIPWVVFYGIFLYSSIRLWLGRHDVYVRGIGAGGIAATLAMLIHSLADFNLQIPSNALLFFIVMGLTWRTVNSDFRRRV
jgi:O-antigen ligase